MTSAPLDTVNASARWRSALRERMRERPYPLFLMPEGVITAATVWTGSRIWTHAFREAGLSAGDRFVLALPPSHAFLQALVAALWEGLTVAVLPPSDDVAAAMATLDARAAAAPTGDAADGVFVAVNCEGPRPVPVTTRAACHPATPDVRFLLRTSGSTRAGGGGRWVALTDAGVWSVLDSHRRPLALKQEDSRLLSVLPWHHAFGLVIELLPALLAGAEVQRDGRGGRDPDALLALAREQGTTHLNVVPLTLRRLLAVEGGARFLRSLEGGVVGGAAVDAELAEFLRSTRLRVGYGQTEASPGITLGEPGEFPRGGYLGRPLGCETRVDECGVLHFCGANACAGFWDAEIGLTRLPADGWRDTGDLVEAAPDGGLFFRGRSDDAFKLSNGRRVEAGRWEALLRDAFPELTEALLFSPDGEVLEACVAVRAGRPAPETAVVRDALGALGGRLCAVRVLPAEAWARTPKGTVHRPAMLERLKGK